jgi:hypothetical protein
MKAGSVLTLILTVALFSLAATEPAAADPKTMFSGVAHKLDEQNLSTLRSQLRSLDEECPKANQNCRAAGELHRALTGDGSELLPVLVVYLDENLEVQTNRLLWKGRVTPFVHDVQNVWVIVIADRQVSLEVSLTNLWVQESSIAKGLRDVFVSSGERDIDARQAQGIIKPLELKELTGEGQVRDELWVGWQRFYIRNGGAYRLRILPADEAAEEAVGFQSVWATFSNSEYQALDFGVGLAVTYLEETVQEDFDLDGIHSGDYLVGAYWMLNVYIKRPILIKPIAPKSGSRYRTSYAVTIGVNLNIFDVEEFLLGLNIGHLFGRNGIVVGANFLNPFDDSKDGDEIQPFVAVNFNF